MGQAGDIMLLIVLSRGPLLSQVSIGSCGVEEGIPAGAGQQGCLPGEGCWCPAADSKMPAAQARITGSWSSWRAEYKGS